MSAKKKKGKVVRLTPDLVDKIFAEKQDDETVPQVIRRLLELKEEPTGYVLPSDLYSDAAEARGAAVMKAAFSKSKIIEKPKAVRVTK